MASTDNSTTSTPPLLTDEQNAAVESLRNTFKDVDGSGMEMNDSTFLRYLRAR